MIARLAIIIISIIILIFMRPQRKVGRGQRKLTFIMYPNLLAMCEDCVKDFRGFTNALVSDEKINPAEHKMDWSRASGLVLTKLRDLLGGKSYFREVDNCDSRPDFCYGYYTRFPRPNGKFDFISNPKYFACNARVKFAIKQETNKKLNQRLLYVDMMRDADLAKYFPGTWDIAALESLPEISGSSDKFYIIKLSGTCAQEGIYLISSNADYIALRRELLAKHGEKAGIISEYVSRPLLVNGIKFNFRVYLGVFKSRDETKFYVFDKYRLYSAAKSYSLPISGEKMDEKAHVTGPRNSIIHYKYEDLAKYDPATYTTENLAAIDREIKNMLAAYCNFVWPYVEKYEDNDVGCTVYGADILFDSNFRGYLLEVNPRTGYAQLGSDKASWDEYMDDFSAEYFAWIHDTILAPYFGLPRTLAEIYEPIYSNKNKFGRDYLWISAADEKAADLDRADLTFAVYLGRNIIGKLYTIADQRNIKITGKIGADYDLAAKKQIAEIMRQRFSPTKINVHY